MKFFRHCMLGFGLVASLHHLNAVELVRHQGDKIFPVPIETEDRYLNEWPEAEEARFMNKADHVIKHFSSKNYRMRGGSTINEREKELYPVSMLWILGGRQDEGVSNLMAPQKYDPASHHAYTDGFDFWYGFTLKGQARKYFHFGHLLDEDYRKRYESAFAKWTKTDPRNTPHPHFKKYDPKKQGWTPERFGNRQIDGRRTDNLYAMTTVTTYLFAEAAGNEEVRQISWDRIREYGVTAFMNGIGEWDSENYISHTMSAYLNLYDFAQDPKVKMHAKGILDWISMSMAVKYWRGGWGGAVKRDYGNIMAMHGNALVASHLYFDDIGLKTNGDRDDVHHITSAYRPPMAVVELARGQIDRPAELLITHPTYENWKKDGAGRSGRDYPSFHETFFFGNTYRFGSLIDGNGGDVSGFTMITENSKRGVDYLTIGHSLDKKTKKAIDKGRTFTRSKFVTTDTGNTNIAQYRNIALYVMGKGNADFFMLTAPGAIKTQHDGIQFLQHEKTWVALTPIGMKWNGRDPKMSASFAQAGDMLVGKGRGGSHAGFAIEIGEEATHGNFATFVKNVRSKSRLQQQGDGQWTYTDSLGQSVGLKYAGSRLGLFVNKKDQPWILDRVRTPEEMVASFPTIWRNGEQVDWMKWTAQYRNPADPKQGPVDLGFKEGTLRIVSDNYTFEGVMLKDGTYTFQNSKR